jgi:uncharacterized membrane protein
MSKAKKGSIRSAAVDRVMPRHAPFYIGLLLGLVALLISIWLLPEYAVSLGANCLFATYLALTSAKVPRLTASYLKRHARDEDTPGYGIVLIVLIVVVASVVSLFHTLMNGGGGDIGGVVASLSSVILGWFTVQVMGALHYAYEYYQVSETAEGGGTIGGLDFPGDEDPDCVAFLYFSFTVGTSVATSDTKVSSNAMRRRVMVHAVFSHFYNTILLAAAVNVLLSLGG